MWPGEIIVSGSRLANICAVYFRFRFRFRFQSQLRLRLRLRLRSLFPSAHERESSGPTELASETSKAKSYLACLLTWPGPARPGPPAAHSN